MQHTFLRKERQDESRSVLDICVIRFFFVHPLKLSPWPFCSSASVGRTDSTGHRRPVAARREAFTLASFDRLRVLTTELKRLIAAGAPVALRLGSGAALGGSRLALALWWL